MAMHGGGHAREMVRMTRQKSKKGQKKGKKAKKNPTKRDRLSSILF